MNKLLVLAKFQALEQSMSQYLLWLGTYTPSIPFPYIIRYKIKQDNHSLHKSMTNLPNAPPTALLLAGGGPSSPPSPRLKRDPILSP